MKIKKTILLVAVAVTGALVGLLLVITASLMLAACSSHKTKSDSAQNGARVEDRGAAGANGAASTSASS